MKSPITRSGTFSLLLTRGHLHSRVTHEGMVWGNVSRHVLSRIPSVTAHRWRASDSYPVTLANACLLWYVSSGRSSGREQTHTHTYTHMLPIIPKVLHWRSTVFPLSRWAGRTKGHVLLTIWEYTLNKFPFIAFICLSQIWLSMLAALQKHLELHSTSLAV